ncbi:hypothetical protein DM860_009385 [Cuscuta australis]|uniref:Rapid alkalinization factor 1 n=1 Tax=Cuscuta australis TaxID=267555 RepID=A0A328DED4_9ASTE|nr:hypothetical protein DM860_009385 [Cuscuta australis]
MAPMINKRGLNLLLLLLLVQANTPPALSLNVADLNVIDQGSSFMQAAVQSFAGAESGGAMDIEQTAEELMMESEGSRRLLFQSRYISYGAMRRDSIPCNRRGPSYYNCRSHTAVRPYTRGCSKFTRCGGRYG